MPSFPPHHETLPHVTKDNWRDLAAQKRQSLYDAFPKDWLLPKGKYDDLVNVIDVPKQCGLLSAKELEITEIDDIPELAKKIAQREFSAVEVASAFSKRAAIAHQLTNCLTEVMFDRAAKRAKELDDHLQQTGQVIGPLHGIPVSLKDQFDIKDVELTMGYAGYLGRISPANSSLVDLLEANGAIIYVRTNIPQTLMIGDAFNHVFGRTCNPRHRKMSPGGSSGGEGALIALKGSIVGIGTDIGGSVRIPSAMCGLFTIRPSSRRMPYGKATNSLLGQESVLSVAGPMCRSLASVEYFMRTVLDSCPADYDASAFPFPFNNKAYDKASQHKKLAFGYCKTDGHVHVAPPVIRAIDETVQALKAAGHDVFEFDMARYKRAWELCCEIFAADGGEDVNRILASVDEPLIDGVILGDESTKKTVYELHQMNREKEAIQQEVLKEWLATVTQSTTGRPMDALIFPAVASPVRRFTDDKHAGLTGVFNILDLPSCVFPVTTVDPAKDPKNTNIEYFNDMDKAIHEQYDPEMGAGMPAAVQVVGRRWQEESLLAVAKSVAKAVGKAV